MEKLIARAPAQRVSQCTEGGTERTEFYPLSARKALGAFLTFAQWKYTNQPNEKSKAIYSELATARETVPVVCTWVRLKGRQRCGKA